MRIKPNVIRFLKKLSTDFHTLPTNLSTVLQTKDFSRTQNVYNHSKYHIFLLNTAQLTIEHFFDILSLYPKKYRRSFHNKRPREVFLDLEGHISLFSTAHSFR